MLSELTSLLDILSSVMAIVVGLFVIVFTMPSFKKHREVVPLALFVFGVISLMLSNAYWIAYDYIRPDVRMPFAANEIGEIAVYLLMATVLNMIMADLKGNARMQIAVTALFVLGSIGLWILWTGEWIQDLFGGIPFGYFLCVCARGLKLTDALTKSQWVILGGLSMTAILLNYIACFIPKTSVWVNPITNVLLVLALAGLLVKGLIAVKGNVDSRRELALTFSTLAFSFAVMFLGESIFYYIANIIGIFAMILMAIAINREVTEE